MAAFSLFKIVDNVVLPRVWRTREMLISLPIWRNEGGVIIMKK